jgi:hypothetical protein
MITTFEQNHFYSVLHHGDGLLQLYTSLFVKAEIEFRGGLLLPRYARHHGLAGPALRIGRPALGLVGPSGAISAGDGFGGKYLLTSVAVGSFTGATSRSVNYAWQYRRKYPTPAAQYPLPIRLGASVGRREPQPA